MESEFEIARLESRLSSLEQELERYHEWLEEAIEQRDRFALNATWGIVKGLTGICAYLGTYYIIFDWLELKGWVWGTVAGVVGFAAYVAAFAWQEGGEEKDIAKLYRLPKWDDRKNSR